MPEYLSPGVYIEEFEVGAKPIEGVSTSTVGFLGEAERGPTRPRLVTSWLDYQRLFGSYFGATQYLPYAVKGFFDNGGLRCYVARIVKTAAASAALRLGDALTVTASGEGAWGNRIALKVGTGSLGDPATFRLDLHYWKKAPDPLFDPGLPENRRTVPRPAVSESFDNLSVDESSPDFYGKRVNGISSLVRITVEAGDTGQVPTDPTAITLLTGGDDTADPLDASDFQRTDTDRPGEKRGLTALAEMDVPLIYVPNVQQVGGLADAIMTHCEIQRYRFAILDAPQASSSVPDLDPRGDRPSEYAAYYYPWIKIIDEQARVERLVPPGGFVAGIYARSDNTRGVHKAPANEKVNGATGLEFDITKGQQDVLNPKGVNVIRKLPGRGILVWGARTLATNSLWKYINVRRLFIFVEDSVFRGTQWVVFEPNNEALWARVRQTITQFLTTVWRTGALMGLTEEEAFFVRCDRTTMTQDDIDNGRLIVVVGLAPTKPAEFVIFRFTQFTAGAETT
jgi:uncharacterized protein